MGEMPVEELRNTLAADSSCDYKVKLLLNEAELFEGSCGDAGLVEGVEIACVKVLDVSRKMNVVSIWAKAQRCKFDNGYWYELMQIFDEQGLDLSVEALVDCKDDERCLDALASLSNLR